MRILVIEDDRATADYVAKGLTEEGHVVDVARDGRDGLFLALNEPFDVVVTDRPQAWSRIADVIAVPLPALARSWPEALPAGVIDGASELMGQPDVPVFATTTTRVQRSGCGASGSKERARSSNSRLPRRTTTRPDRSRARASDTRPVVPMKLSSDGRVPAPTTRIRRPASRPLIAPEGPRRRARAGPRGCSA